MVVVFITLANSNEIFIWQNGLLGCIEHRGQQSVADTYTNLFQCNIINYCSNNSFKRFTRTTCGHIRSTSRKTNMQWWISQSKRTVLKWNIIEFMVFKNDAHCSFSHVAWTTESKQSYYCGHHLPWKEHTKGNVTIIQRFMLTLKHSLYFELFFNVDHHKYLTPQKKNLEINVNKVVHISPRFSHFVHSDDLMLFLVGPFPFQIFNITITSLKGTVLQDLTIYDGPSKLTSMLSLYNTDGRNFTCKTSSFQALLVVSINITTEHMASIRWSSHIQEVEGNCWILRSYCNNWNTLRPGLALMVIHTNDTGIYGMSYRFNGPNTYSNAVDVFCQYGGMWLYSSSERTFTNPTLMLEKCTNKRFSDVLYSRLKCFARVVVQYPGISKSMIQYFTKPKHQSAPNFYVSPVYPDQTIVIEQQFYILQIFARLENLHNVSVYLTDSSYINDITVADITFRHITPEESCTCEAIISHIHVHDEQKWCTTSPEHNVQRQILSSVASRKKTLHI